MTAEVIADDAVAVVEDTAKLATDVVRLLDRKVVVVGGTAVLAAAAGFGVAWYVQERRWIKKYEAQLTEEIENAKRTYRRLPEAPDEKPPLEDLVIDSPVGGDDAVETTDKEKAARNVMVDYRAISTEDKGDPETDNIIKNVFDDRSRITEDDIKARSEDEPYIISVEEWEAGELQQVGLTYYQGDETLVDDKDEPIEKVDYVVGTENLQRFGHASGDHNTLFIRNHKMDVDIEVTRSYGKYTEEVLGLQHSWDRPGSRKQPRFKE